MAGGQSLPCGAFKPERPVKVIYLATELPKDHAQFVKICFRSLSVNMEISEKESFEQNLKENFVLYPEPGKDMDVDLFETEGWMALDNIVMDADVIVIDHLLDVLSGANTGRNWSKFWNILKRYRTMGKTIILLHHLGKSGKQKGEIDLVKDADIVLNLHKSKKHKSGVEIVFDKLRSHDPNFFESGSVLTWKRGVEKSTYVWTLTQPQFEDDEVPEGRVLASHENEEAVSSFCENQAGRYIGPILRYLINKSIDAQEGWCAPKELKNAVGCKSDTITKAMSDLAGYVVDNGMSTSGKRYRLSAKGREMFLIPLVK